jgi:hypothetical protein
MPPLDILGYLTVNLFRAVFDDSMVAGESISLQGEGKSI